LHVFAKLFEDRLEWRLEAKAFSGREIVDFGRPIAWAIPPIEWPNAFNKPICSLSSSDKCE
jgi:hypothetical protein